MNLTVTTVKDLEKSIEVPGQFSELQKNFERLKSAILDRRPVLKEIIKKHGHKSLYSYAQDYLDVNKTSTNFRREEFLVVFEEETSRILGKEVAASAVEQLRKYFFVSTADHHGPVCHPFFLNADLIISSSYVGHDDPALKNAIILSCSNVSLNNSSFPRGLLFNTRTTNGIEMHRLFFLPSNCHAAAVYNFRPFKKEDLIKLRGVIKDKLKNGFINENIAGKLNDILTNIYDKENVLALKTYADQISVTNFELWKQFFGNTPIQHPNLIYIEQETLVTKLLQRFHLNKETAIYKILFDPSYENLIYKYFEGIMGAFSRTEKSGTYMFWGILPNKHDRFHLWRQGNRLVSDDGEFNIELTPEAIGKALEVKRIIPSMMLIFMVLSFYYGLKCLGGVNQVNYLTLMKEAYIKMQTEKDDQESVLACEDVQTKEFVDGPTITFLKGINGELVPAAGLDLLLYGDNDTWAKIVEQSKTLTLEEAFNPLLPEYYPVMYPEVEREQDLSAITSKDITLLTHFDDKIKPCVCI